MKLSFTLREVGNLMISVLVLGLLFSLSNIEGLITNTLIIGLAFVVHELSHKFVAQHFDCKSEYVLWPQGILFSLIIGLITRGNIIFAALGYVSISTYYTTRLGFQWINLSLEETGKISASGPVSNIILGVISAILMPFIPILSFSVWINFILAIFNLLPFPPLDGSKVIMWSRITWVSLIVTAGSVFALTMLINPLIAGLIGLIIMLATLFFSFYKGL